jgi:PhnB protein
MQINPYICLPGTAKEALKLYSQVFKTEPDAISYFKDTPADAGMEVSAANADRVMHASIKVGENYFMISDAPDSLEATTVFGNVTKVSIHPDSREDADRVFALLSEGGKVTMPMADAFWGDYFGMAKDKFGVAWMINYSPKG